MVLTLPSHRLADVPLGGVVGVVAPAGMVTPGGVVETVLPLAAPPPPPPPQLAAHTAIKKIAVIRENVAVVIEMPIYTALLKNHSLILDGWWLRRARCRIILSNQTLRRALHGQSGSTWAANCVVKAAVHVLG